VWMTPQREIAVVAVYENPDAPKACGGSDD